MLAAKHFDPVIGIDIHIIQPPGPVPPVPIPHPFIGFLMDPADYVPIIGSTVQINGMHRAQAGTAGKCVPPHIPIGGVFVPPPPGNECEMFMGSATVEIDGEAQSYMSLPVLSCQSVGMPSLPRMTPKKKTIPKCLMLPTSQVLPIPAGPPVMIGGPPTISIMGMAMKAGMAGLGKLGKGLRKLQRGSGKIGKAMRKLSKTLRDKAKGLMTKMGVPPSVQNKVSRAICAVTGHPVDIATGKVFTEAVDLELPGPLPFRFERVWFSTSVYQGPLGHGWHHSYDLALTEEDGAVAVRMADGRPIAFPALRKGESHFDRTERMTLHRDQDGYRLEEINGISYRFGLATFDTTIQKLLSVSNRPGFRIEFRYDSYGRLEEIIDSAGRRLPVRCDDSGRIVEIRGPHPDKANQTIPLACYDYNTAGDLVKVRDALDQPMKFRYEDHLLVKETDRNGLSFYFEYSRHGDQIRCHHTWGDGGIYNHRLEYDLELRSTRVTNSLGHTTTHYWNEHGLVLTSIDPLGGVRESLYNEFAEIIEQKDELGRTTRFEYDDSGNRKVVGRPDESHIELAFNESGQPLSAVDAAGRLWSWDYNHAGQLLAKTDPNGSQIRCEYSLGQLVTIFDTAGNPTRLSYDSQGNIESIIQRNGSCISWKYDHLGRPIEQKDPRGNSRISEYDLCGRLVRRIEADGNFCTMRYDAVGNLTYFKDVDDEVRLTYQGLGRIASRRQSGTTITFTYDTEEDLLSITNSHGAVYRFERNERGSIVREFGFDSIRRIYTHDAAQRLLRVERAAGEWSQFTYDALDQVVEVQYSDGATESYEYSRSGDLLKATNDAAVVAFERDSVGRIVKECQNDVCVTSTFELSGMRSSMRTSLGSEQSITRDSMGYVTGMAYRAEPTQASEPLWQTDIIRDQLGYELERTLPGGVRSRWERDTYGRPVRHDVVAGGDGRNTAYRWRSKDRLELIRNSASGETIFEHDPCGVLVSATHSDGSVVLKMPDAVGNLFRTRDRSDRKYGPSGQLLEAQTPAGRIRYEYDLNGNLLRKNTPDGIWTFHWNVAGKLTSVTTPAGLEIEYCYDALGRRIEKRTGDARIRWHWDGNTPVHQVTMREPAKTIASLSMVTDSSSMNDTAAAVSDTQPSTAIGAEDRSPEVETWIYDPESFTPAARFLKSRSDSIISDHLGTPSVLVSKEGTATFLPEASIYGERALSSESVNEFPGGWPGQFYDDDIGLYYNRYRFYDPDSGIYISPDPSGLLGSMSLYAYVTDVTCRIDPLGLNECAPKKKLGLGLWDKKNRPEFDKWAESIGAQRYGALSGRGSFSEQIDQAMRNADEIHFRLDDVSPRKASPDLNDYGEPSRGYTNYELAMIRDNPDFMSKTTWWKDGEPMPKGYNPFL